MKSALAVVGSIVLSAISARAQETSNGPPAEPLLAPAEQPSSGQWVYTSQYGWVWMPYGDQYVYEPPRSGSSQPSDADEDLAYSSEWAAPPGSYVYPQGTYVVDAGAYPYSYVYYPAYGWTWVISPWIWGVGPRPYFGAYGPRRYAWYSRPRFQRGWAPVHRSTPVPHSAGGHRSGAWSRAGVGSRAQPRYSRGVGSGGRTGVVMHRSSGFGTSRSFRPSSGGAFAGAGVRRGSLWGFGFHGAGSVRGSATGVHGGFSRGGGFHGSSGFRGGSSGFHAGGGRR